MGNLNCDFTVYSLLFCCLEEWGGRISVPGSLCSDEIQSVSSSPQNVELLSSHFPISLRGGNVGVTYHVQKNSQERTNFVPR